ncbi:MAG: hypothetical protein QOD06_1037 [Candidatus Binatota bacterium]|jgi:hypothetical protein|nr:hypothetical protein [Candidatus Binatota bacterium]
MFQLTKLWVDPFHGIDTVEIRYTWSPIGEPARWEGEEEAEVMWPIPNTNPIVRQVTIEIPREVNGQEKYQLHYRFGGGGERRRDYSPVITEEIVSCEVPYVDEEGRITQVRLLWGVNGWVAPNWTATDLDGLSLGGVNAGPQAGGDGIVDDAIYELVQTVPLPRRWVGRVWGPKGSVVEYVYQLLRTGSPLPEDDFEIWDNNQTQNYRLTL